MATNSLYPAFFRLFSRSEFAPHIATIPTRAWEPDLITTGGNFLNWSDELIPADVMIEDFVDLLLPFFTPDTSYNQAIVYTMDSPTDPPRPRAFISFTGKIGTSVAAAVPASQSQYTFRSTTFGLFKLLFFDAPVATDFRPFNDIALSPDLEAIHDFISDSENAFAARDNGRPNGFVRATFKLNDELRKQYKLA